MSRAIDLIPAEQLLEHTVRQRALRWVFVLVFAVGAILILHGWLYARVRGVEAELTAAREQVATMRKPEEQLAPLVAQLQDTQRKHALVRNLTLEPYWPQFLFDLSAAAPPGMVLTGFRASRLVESSAAAPAAGDGTSATPLQPLMSMTLQGTAAVENDVIALLGALSMSAEVRTLNLTFSRSTTDSKGNDLIEFGLEGTIQPAGSMAAGSGSAGAGA